jgi:hypothetical protein
MCCARCGHHFPVNNRDTNTMGLEKMGDQLFKILLPPCPKCEVVIDLGLVELTT